MTDYRTFTDYFDSLGVRNFSAQEFTGYFQVHRRGVTNSEPPREIWGNIVPTLRIVDALRSHLRRPIVLLSSYRSPAYNRAIGDAAPRSLHLRFNALDIAVSGRTPRQVFDVLLDWREEEKFKGGLGLYNTFVHIDTRGTNATWGT
jgi:uncharacterized protein YcbK (DUF882 family)